MDLEAGNLEEILWGSCMDLGGVSCVDAAGVAKHLDNNAKQFLKYVTNPTTHFWTTFNP